MMKINDLVNDYGLILSGKMSDENISEAKEALRVLLFDYDVTPKSTDLSIPQENVRSKAIQMFFVAKKIEGCTNSTLAY